jgi:hypothetical protein
MKAIITSALALCIGFGAQAQEKPEGEPDTTHINIGEKQIIIISPGEVKVRVDGDETDGEKEDKPSVEAHWAGIEFGPTMLMNGSFSSDFPNNKQWENDPGRSFSWNFNVFEHKFPIYRNNVGITTGLGFNVTGVGLKQEVLVLSDDSLYTFTDTINTYDKNKLRAFYLTVPLMIDLCTNGDSDDDGFYLAAGVIGGLRIGSNVKTVIDTDSRDIKEKNRSTFGLEAFRLDAAVKVGYNGIGLFANYALTPLFNTAKTDAVYPLTFGMTFNF